jgi:hypothetical protein
MGQKLKSARDWSTSVLTPQSGHAWGPAIGEGKADPKLNQLQSLEAGVAFLADNNVVVHGNAERVGHGDDLLRHLDIGARRRRVAGRMIVQQMLQTAITLKSL